MSITVASARFIIPPLAKHAGFYQHIVKRISPLIHHASPEVYNDCLNSLAVELGQVGRKYEARNIAQAVVESPLIQAYPEWLQTAGDLQQANRSFIVPNPSPARIGKLLSMPPVEQTEPIKQDRPAPIVSLEQWKKKMGKEPNGENKIDPKKMTEKEKLFKIIELSSQESITEYQLDQILDAILKITSKRD